MGKQLSLYLPDKYVERLFVRATRNYRRLHDEARYILFTELDREDPVTQPQQPNNPIDVPTPELEAVHAT